MECCMLLSRTCKACSQDISSTTRRADQEVERSRPASATQGQRHKLHGSIRKYRSTTADWGGKQQIYQDGPHVLRWRVDGAERASYRHVGLTKQKW